MFIECYKRQIITKVHGPGCSSEVLSPERTEVFVNSDHITHIEKVDEETSRIYTKDDNYLTKHPLMDLVDTLTNEDVLCSIHQTLENIETQIKYQ